MDRRQFVITAFGAGLAALGAEGCGGGGSSAFGGNSSTSGGLLTTRGAVQLPSGSSLTPAQLLATNSLGSKPLSSNGSFTATTDPSAPELLLITHVNGRGVMFGFVDPATSSNILNSQAIAEALLYFALGGNTFPADHKRDVLAIIQKDPATAPLATVIAARIAKDSFALEDGDAQIAAALTTAYNAILAEASRGAFQITGAASQTKYSSSLPTRGSAIPLDILIQPTTLQSGLEVVQDTSNTNITGVIATNHYRRRCQALLYQVADNSTGAIVNYPLAKLVGSPADLPSTTRIGLNTALTGFFGGTTPFTPVSTNTLPLSLVTGSTQTNFEVVVLGAINGTLTTPAFVSEPKYANEVAGWTATQELLNLKSLLMDMFFGLALEMLGFGGAVPLDSQVSAAFNAVNAIQDLPVRTLLQHASTTGGIGVATIDLLKLAAGSDTVGSNLRKQLAVLLQTATQQAALEASQGLPLAVLNTMLKMLLNVLNAAQLVLGAGDISAMIHDLTVSNDAELWTAALLQPVVSITPNAPTVSFGSDQSFKANLPTGVTGTILYDWSTTALFGVLSDGNGKTGRSFETSSATVDLQTTPSDVSPLTVAVTAIQVGLDGTRRTIGDAKATVTLTLEAPKTIAAGKLYLENFPVNGGLYGYAFIAAWFYTFQYDPNAVNYYVTDGDNVDYELYQTQIQKGAPVLTAANFGDVLGYASGFYNLGNGLIGVMAYSLAGSQVTQAPLVRNDVNAAAKGHSGTVRIMY